MNNQNVENVKKILFNKLNDLIKEANSLNMVLSIDIKSLTPLAMGNVFMEPTVRQQVYGKKKYLTKEEIFNHHLNICVSMNKSASEIILVTLAWEDGTRLIALKIDGDIEPFGIIEDIHWGDVEKHYMEMEKTHKEETTTVVSAGEEESNFEIKVLEHNVNTNNNG